MTELGVVLPETVAPAANYVPFKNTGSLIYISGQVLSVAGKDQFVGKLGQNITLAEGQTVARVCVINELAQLKAAIPPVPHHST